MESQRMPFCFYILNIRDIYAVASLGSCLISGMNILRTKNYPSIQRAFCNAKGLLLSFPDQPIFGSFGIEVSRVNVLDQFVTM
jgi:hypothetical protein